MDPAKVRITTSPTLTGRHRDVPSQPRLRIVVAPVIDNGRYTGRFSTRLPDGRELVPRARCPLFESARVLVAEGRDPDTVLEMIHIGASHVAMSGRLRRLAELTVAEGANYGPDFAKFTPFDRAPAPGASCRPSGPPRTAIPGRGAAPPSHEEKARPARLPSVIEAIRPPACLATE